MGRCQGVPVPLDLSRRPALLGSTAEAAMGRCQGVPVPLDRVDSVGAPGPKAGRPTGRALAPQPQGPARRMQNLGRFEKVLLRPRARLCGVHELLQRFCRVGPCGF